MMLVIFHSIRNLSSPCKLCLSNFIFGNEIGLGALSKESDQLTQSNPPDEIKFEGLTRCELDGHLQGIITTRVCVTHSGGDKTWVNPK